MDVATVIEPRIDKPKTGLDGPSPGVDQVAGGLHQPVERDRSAPGPGLRIDVHQHVWTAPLVQALTSRQSLPRVVREGGQLSLRISGEGPSWIESPASPDPGDGVDLALVAFSSPVGIEQLPRLEATELIDAHLAGVAALGPSFAAWGPIALDRLDPDDVERVLDLGCVGISLPADALGTPEKLRELSDVLTAAARRGAPVFVHPGPGADPRAPQTGWWAPMTRYVSQMQAAWLSFVAYGRPRHPDLTVVFAMLAGAAPLMAERLAARGGPAVDLLDERIFYDTSSFGVAAIEAMARQVGQAQLVYGSDRPVIDPVGTSHDTALKLNAARLLSPARDGA